MSEKIFVRKCAGIDEFQRCVALQKEIWGEEDIEVEPARLRTKARVSQRSLRLGRAYLA